VIGGIFLAFGYTVRLLWGRSVAAAQRKRGTLIQGGFGVGLPRLRGGQLSLAGIAVLPWRAGTARSSQTRTAGI
jgi:hypothetical protein